MYIFSVAHLALLNDGKGPTVVSGVSLYQQLIKTASLSILSNMKSTSADQCSPPPYSLVLVDLFSVLCNSVSSQECRAAIKKVCNYACMHLVFVSLFFPL